MRATTHQELPPDGGKSWVARLQNVAIATIMILKGCPARAPYFGYSRGACVICDGVPLEAWPVTKLSKTGQLKYQRQWVTVYRVLALSAMRPILEWACTQIPRRGVEMK